MPEFRSRRSTNSTVLQKASPKWKSLELSKTLVDDDGVEEIVRRCPHLEEILLVSDILSDRSIAALCQLPNLRSLFLYGLPLITDHGVSHLAHASELRELVIENTQITDAGIDAITGLQHLLVIGIRNAQISNVGMAKLGALSTLMGVGLEMLQIDGHGLEVLPNAIRTSLGVDDSPVTDDGLTEYLLTHDLIESLSLSQTLITDLSMPRIAKCENISDLRLNNTKVTDEGLKFLLGHKSLMCLYLEGCAVSERAINELKAAAPHRLVVYRD